MLDRRSNEANCPACHHACDAVSKYRQLSLLLFASSPHGSWLSSSSGLNYVLVDQAAVLCKGSQHHAIHAHPAHERRSSAFVEAIEAFFSDGLEEAVERALELRVRLEADLYGIEWMTLAGVSQNAPCIEQQLRPERRCSPDTQFCYAREDTSDETLVLAAVSRAYGFLSVIFVDAGRRGFLHRHESAMIAQRATRMMFIVSVTLREVRAQSDRNPRATASSLINDRRAVDTDP